MFKKSNPIFMRAITPVHAGSGQDIGIVDMPIQRERHTGIPKIEGSGIKGVFREFYYRKINDKDAKNDKALIQEINDVLFGPEDSEKHAASLGFTDARLLLFPVRSLKGMFALITCPYVLKRFREDLDICDLKNKNKIIKEIINELDKLIAISENLPEGKCYVFNESMLSVGKNIFLEEYMYEFDSSRIKENKIFDKFTDIAEQTLGDKIKERTAILSDEDFMDFVTMYTEIITRNRIVQETGTTDDSALFTEEYLPAESILYTLVLASDRMTDKDKKYTAEENMKNFKNNFPDLVQIGGNATVGKGLVRVKLLDISTEDAPKKGDVSDKKLQ